MNNTTVLVSGASIAGPSLAFWLNRFGFEVTVIERAAELRLGGQNIDIRGAAQTVARLMGVEENIRAANTGEIGVRFVDTNNRIKAAFPKGDGSFTGELEILRGDLAKILYDSTRANVEYIFGNQITAIEEQDDLVRVAFRHGPPRLFNLVLAADGIRSSTRQLIFGDEPVIKFKGLYNAYLTIPRTATDTAWACWYNAPGSRVITTRPDNVGTTRAAFSFLSTDKGYEKLDISAQKKILKGKFADAGWQAPRILAALDTSRDVYLDGISQVIAPRWSKGRCAMVGDAAYCPTPLSGMGASLSMVGAYVLAGELHRNKDHTTAFAAYEQIMQPFVEDVQNLPPGVPWIAHPKTKFGIAIFNTVLAIASSTVVQKMSSIFSSKRKAAPKEKIALPEY